MSNDSGRFATLCTYLAAAGLLLLGCVVGVIIRDRMHGKPKRPYTALREPGWEYVNPLLDCEQGGDTLQNEELRSLSRTLSRAVLTRPGRGK